MLQPENHQRHLVPLKDRAHVVAIGDAEVPGLPAGLIEYHPGAAPVERAGLEHAACSCHATDEQGYAEPLISKSAAA
ncbi:hypothetical protein VLK31_19310 [Variovorax sp. H27-G14]|uniref:hypothetical protein n=1 Tax=Variovorax sp. H27-G14 TaxID=3111914 RepID=UPI0038FC9342